MFLKHKDDHSLVEILNLEDLWDACVQEVLGRYHAGEELQDPELFRKVDLIFPSDERLPQCWIDPHYRQRGVLIQDNEAIAH